VYINVPITTDVADPPVSAIINTGIAVYMYIARCTMTDFSSSGVQRLKGYFYNNNDSYILAVIWVLLVFMFNTYYVFHKKQKEKVM